jgi:hypothetical protein
VVWSLLVKFCHDREVVVSAHSPIGRKVDAEHLSGSVQVTETNGNTGPDGFLESSVSNVNWMTTVLASVLLERHLSQY